MKNKLTVGLIQMRMSRTKQKNLDKALKMIEEASQRGAQLVCLPELFTTRYFPREENFAVDKAAEAIPGPTTEVLSRVAREKKIILIGGSICERSNGKFYNTTIVFDENGKIIGRYRKVHIPHDPNFYEQNYFEKGNLGYVVVGSRYCRIGTMICYDQWYPEAARINALMGAEILFYPTAIGRVKGIEQSEGDWRNAWENVQRGHAIANGVIVAAVNRVGREGDMNFWGSSFVVDQFGKNLIRGSSREEILIVKCDIQLGKKVREGWRFLYNRRPDTYRRLLKK